MGTLESVLLVLLIVDALALTILVLLQQGKGVLPGRDVHSMVDHKEEQAPVVEPREPVLFAKPRFSRA